MNARLGAVLSVGLVAACLWSAPPNVDVQGKVLLTVCAGTEPKDPPPGWSQCGTEAVTDATVLAAPTQGLVITAQSDSSGTYRMELAPGSYMIAVIVSKPVRVSSQPRWLVVSAQPSEAFDLYPQLNMA